MSIILNTIVPKNLTLDVDGNLEIIGNLGISGVLNVSNVSGLGHSELTGLLNDDHTQYTLLAGRTGGQTVIGGTAASNNLTLNSTSNATKGSILIPETTASTSTTTGALTVAGGVGIAGALQTGATSTIRGNLLLGGSSTSNYIAFRGTTGDDPGLYRTTFIGERIYANVESSELLLFKGNDGDDRVRLSAGMIAFDTTTTFGTFEEVASTGTRRMTILNNGNVGIGTSEPDRGFHIQSNNGVLRLDRNTGTTGIQLHRFPLNDFSSSPLKGFILGVDADGVNDGEFSIGDYGTAVSGGFTKRLIITNEGAVKVTGTTASTSTTTGALTVAGGVGIGGEINANGPATFQKGNASGNFANNQLLFGFSDTSDYRHAIKTRHQANNNNSNNAFDFYVWQTTDAIGSVGSKQVMSVTSAGVGIGTTTPGRLLDVSGTARITGVTEITNTTASTSTSTGALTVSGGVGVAGALNVGGNSIISGNLGLGITPTTRLHVSGNTKITNNNYIELGDGITKELSAGRIGYQIFTTGLDIVGAGTISADRIVRIFNNLTVEDNISSLNAVVSGTTASTSTTTGALKVAGGISSQDNIISKNILDAQTSAIAWEDQSLTTLNTAQSIQNIGTSFAYLQNQYIQLTNATTNQQSTVYWQQTPGNSLYAKFDIFYGGGTGADGISFGFYQTNITDSVYVNSGGIYVFFNEFKNYIKIYSPTESGEGEALTVSTYTNLVPANTWATVHIIYNLGLIRVHINGIQRGSRVIQHPETIADSVNRYIKFTGATGGSTNNHRIRNVEIRKNVNVNQYITGETILGTVEITGTTGTTSTDVSTGALTVTAGGVGIVGDSNFSNIRINATGNDGLLVDNLDPVASYFKNTLGPTLGTAIQIQVQNTGNPLFYTKVGTTYYFSTVTAASYFTGQHMCSSDDFTQYDVENLVGLIVYSIGEYSSKDQITGSETIGKDAIQINESLPKIKLTTVDADKRVFGVITDSNDSPVYDDAGNLVKDYEEFEFERRIFGRIRINSLGEGAVWVCNINGNVENGDYITSSSIPGYGKVQTDDLLHSYTVAKATCSVNFATDLSKYNIRYLNIDGTLGTPELHDYIAAFIGCTYHCG